MKQLIFITVVALTLTTHAVEFERSHMTIIPGLYAGTYQRVEGYWGQHEHDHRDNLPFPIAHAEPWPGQKEFLKKLISIESSAQFWDHDSLTESRIQIFIFKGSAHSRLESHVQVSNKEFYDTCEQIRWPHGFSWYYVARFNVKPSKEFYDYVMNFELT
jgi:hypothetical protein